MVCDQAFGQFFSNHRQDMPDDGFTGCFHESITINSIYQSLYKDLPIGKNLIFGGTLIRYERNNY